MQPLLKIQSIPIKIEAQTKRASLQQSTEPVPAPQRRPQQRPIPQPQQQRPAPQQQRQAEAPDSRVNQNRNIQRAPVADNTNSYLQDASNAVQAYSQSGVVGDASVAPVATPQPAPVEYQAPAVNFEPVQSATVPTSFDYSMDRETFDWNTNSKPQLEYIPASIEYSIAQYPEVVIEYVGEPIYVPASANPNYVPPPEAKNKA